MRDNVLIMQEGEKELQVLLPVYNADEFLCENLESLLHQTYSDFELVIINDCSTDMTSEILAEYEKNDATIVRHTVQIIQLNN